jgi:hypothetical protein
MRESNTSTKEIFLETRLPLGGCKISYNKFVLREHPISITGKNCSQEVAEASRLTVICLEQVFFIFHYNLAVLQRNMKNLKYFSSFATKNLFLVENDRKKMLLVFVAILLCFL